VTSDEADLRPINKALPTPVLLFTL
jgi:hypothetical protein